MTTPRIFQAELNKWANGVEGDLEALARQVCMELSERVVISTPVDTGFLRSSWQPSLNSPEKGKGSIGGSVGAVTAHIGAVVSDLKVGDIYWMTNNAKYAPFVEFGTAKMAGRFYVTDNMKKFPAIVAQVAAELTK